HCIAVDPWFIVSAEREHSNLIRTAREVNDSKPYLVLEKVLEKADRFKNPTIAALGIALKANIDDLRESPTRNIAGAVAEKLTDGTVLAVEPNSDEPPHELGDRDNVELTELAAAPGLANNVLLLDDHDPTSQLDRDRLAEKIISDTTGLWR